MDEKFIKQAMAEVIAANEQALGIVVAALAKHIQDADKLLIDLQSQIAVAKGDKTIPPLAIRQATVALAAVHAETLLRKNPSAKH